MCQALSWALATCQGRGGPFCLGNAQKRLAEEPVFTPNLEKHFTAE